MEEVNASLPGNQSRNKELGITGMILSHKNFYLQVFEGERSAVSGLLHKIMNDKRHTGVTIIRLQDIKRHEFTGWEYAVVDKNLDEIFYEYITDLIAVDVDFKEDITGSCATGILRRAHAILTTTKAPNRRATDIKELPQLRLGN
jgi:hypothetical protein